MTFELLFSDPIFSKQIVLLLPVKLKLPAIENFILYKRIFNIEFDLYFNFFSLVDYSRHQANSVSPSRSYGSNASQSSNNSPSSYNSNTSVPMANGSYSSTSANMATSSQGLFNGKIKVPKQNWIRLIAFSLPLIDQEWAE